MRAKWRKFEELVADIQRALDPNVELTTNERIRGRFTGKLRQVDIALRHHAGGHAQLIIADAKDRKRKIDVREFDSIMGLGKDVGANLVIIVSAKGYTSSVLSKVRYENARLLTLVDSRDHEWRVNIRMPAVAIIRAMKSMTVQFRLPPDVSSSVLLPSMPFYTSDGSLVGYGRDLVKAGWEAGEYPQLAGTNEGLRLSERPLFVKEGARLIPVQATVRLEVEHKAYRGYAELDGAYGFADVVTKIITAPPQEPLIRVLISEDMRGWEEVDPNSEVVSKSRIRIDAQRSPVPFQEAPEGWHVEVNRTPPDEQ